LEVKTCQVSEVSETIIIVYLDVGVFLCLCGLWMSGRMGVLEPRATAEDMLRVTITHVKTW